MFESIVESDEVDLKVEWVNGVPFIHVQIYKWKPSLVKKYYNIWYDLLNLLAHREVPCVFSSIPVNDSKLYKFQLMFGMKEVKRDSNMILFMVETE
jgi:hypothetical protein